MESIRQRQVAETVKRNISTVLQQEGGYIYGNEVLVTVTSVIMSPDLLIAKIYLSVWNTENKQAPILLLEDAYPQIRHALGNRLKKQVRRIPHLQFFLDDTVDEMYRVNALLSTIEKDEEE